jgi:hypothetical protein
VTLRHGASEVFRIVVRCELVDGGHHEVRLRLKINNNRITFEGACDWRTAQAVEKLSDAVTCRTHVALMRDAIRKRYGLDINVCRCTTCSALAIPFDGCPACGGRTFDAVPAWQRIYRVGRVS